MNKNVIKGSRQIKYVDKTYKKGDIYLHPLTLQIRKVKNDKITPTESYYDPVKKRIKNVRENDNVNFSEYEIQKYMSLPYLNLSYDIVLIFYQIYNIDDFNKVINLKINSNNPLKNIIRLANMWIKNNFSDLMNNNNYIYSLFKRINDKYYKLEHNKETMTKFIDKWFANKDINDFDFDLFNDIFNFIKNK
jgi:hypothetical protein